MSKPRTPRYFPRMKVRGARRRQQAKWDRLARSFDLANVALARSAAAFEALGLVLAHLLPGVTRNGGRT